MVIEVAVKHGTEIRGVCGIFAIGPFYQAVLSNIDRLVVEEPERPRMTITGRHGICGQATESHSVTLGLCNVTSDGADVAGHAASRVCQLSTDVKEAGRIRDEHGSMAG